MKKLLFTCLMTSLTTLTFAQTTFNQSNFIKTGNKITQHSFESGTPLTVQTGGTNKTWDFSFLTKDDTTILRVYNVDYKPAIAAKFPTSNLMLTEDDTNYILVKNSSAGAELVGFYSTEDDEIDGEGFSQFLAPYPLNNTTNTSKTSTVPIPSTFLGVDPDGPGIFPTVDSFKFNVDFNRIFKGIGYGNVSFASGTINNCTMVEVLTINSQSNFKLFVNGAWITAPTALLAALELGGQKDSSYEHQWWSTSSGFGFPLISYNFEDGKYNSVEFSDKPAQLTSVRNIPTVSVNVFPNPANDILSINSNFNSQFTTYEILDLSGKKVLEGKFNGKDIKTSILNAGLYTLKLNGNKVATATFVKN